MSSGTFPFSRYFSQDGSRFSALFLTYIIFSLPRSAGQTIVMKSKTSREQSMLMDKWSAKTTEQNASRVRDNQRRHRARVKSRMEELEARLEETTAKLEAAISTITSLTAEVEAFRASQSSTSSHPGLLRPLEATAQFLDQDPQPSQMTSTSPGCSVSKTQRPAPTMGSPTQEAEPIVPALASVEDDPICDCSEGLPPPAPGESTMSCSSALQIIEQQNYSGVEVTTIKAWLGPGFRLRPGEACRVETNRLYELLDHITSRS